MKSVTIYVHYQLIHTVVFYVHSSLNGDALLKMKVNTLRASASVSVEQLTVVPSSSQIKDETSFRLVLNNLTILLRLWNVKCLNLTNFEMNAELLRVLVTDRTLEKLRSTFYFFIRMTYYLINYYFNRMNRVYS